MAEKLTDPGLEQFVVENVHLTGNQLGAGAYGSVEEVEIPGARVAAKKLHSQLINLGSPQQVEKWMTDFVKECKLMSRLRHPHIVQFLGVCYLPGSPTPVLLMEKLQTNLDSLLETTPNIPLDVKVHFLTGIVQGVLYLHSHTPPIAHRDLTARNILVDSGLTAKIADLGVARMVTIQPGQLAATMTAGPGNNLYMPPETVDQEDGATRYNTAIDIFSFGVVSLFTLTQTFPKDLKPATYYDSQLQRIVGRSEIERREKYVALLKSFLGKTDDLVMLTLSCLEYRPHDRPSAAEILKQLNFITRVIPQYCTQETKLQLFHQYSTKEEQIKQKEAQLTEMKSEYERLQTVSDQLSQQISIKEEQIRQYETLLSRKDDQLTEMKTKHENLQETFQTVHDQILNEAEAAKVEHQKQLKEKDDLYQAQLTRKNSQIKSLQEAKEKMKDELSTQVGSLDLATVQQQLLNPASIEFVWRKCKDIPDNMDVYSQPVALGGKLYVSGEKKKVKTVLEYTPDKDRWADLPTPPVKWFTVATVKGQLALVGGANQSSTRKRSNIFLLGTKFFEWSPFYLEMPKALTHPTVVEYNTSLIIAGGQTVQDIRVSDVIVLNSDNKWIKVEPLPRTDRYRTAIVGDFVYLFGQDTRTVLEAYLPKLLLGAISGVWKSLPSIPYFNSSPIAVDNTLMSVGGSSDTTLRGNINLTDSIHVYDPDICQWIQVGCLPKPMRSPNCIAINSELFVLGDYTDKSLFVSKLILKY